MKEYGMKELRILKNLGAANNNFYKTAIINNNFSKKLTIKIAILFIFKENKPLTMTREFIGQVVLDQWKKIAKRDTDIEREININRLINNDRIIAISGVRQSGKTTLLLQIMKKIREGYFLSFDDERLNSFELSDFQTLMKFFKNKALNKPKTTSK